MKILVFYFTCADDAEAEKIIMKMLEQRLIACANVHNAQSFYAWEGKLTKDHEVIVRIKTSLYLLESCKEFIKEQHSYDTPCIWWQEVNCDESYGNWVQAQIE